MLRPSEMELFRSCRRAWDFGARVRQNHVPLVPAPGFDFYKAMRTGLAAYYFPAMDDWSRSIVRPLAVQAFQRAMREHRTAYEAAAGTTADQEREWTQYLRLGEVVLNRYFDWAVPNDDFDSVLADEDLWVPIPDPSQPGAGTGHARRAAHPGLHPDRTADLRRQRRVLGRRPPDRLGRVGRRRRPGRRRRGPAGPVGRSRWRTRSSLWRERSTTSCGCERPS